MIKKGNRKLFALCFCFIFSGCIAIILRNNSDVLIPLFSLLGGVAVAFFTSNYGEHKSSGGKSE